MKLKPTRKHQPLTTALPALILAATLPASAAADPTNNSDVAAPLTINSTDKSDYSFRNPTPDELLRDLSPDRPDATESPATVDAGRVAMEVSLFDWRHNDGDDSYTVMATNLKLGLNHRTDLQFVFDAFSWEDPTRGSGVEGFGDVQVRLKRNLWGNDGGDTALALFPYVKIPTGTSLSNDEWEGGLIIPFSAKLGERAGLGLMAEFDYVYDGVLRDHQFEFLHSAVVGVDLTERVGAFVEYIGITGEDTPYRAFAAGGLTLTLSDHLVLDCGAQVGLNDAAEDLGVFAGFTRRF